jgi:hypothetical protein
MRSGEVWPAAITIIAIVLGCSATAIVKMVIRHRERMAKIGMGIDPDFSSPEGSMFGDRAHRD